MKGERAGEAGNGRDDGLPSRAVPGNGWVLAMLAASGGCAWLRSRAQAAAPLPGPARDARLEGSSGKRQAMEIPT